MRPLIYAGTAQEQAWSLIASGIKASLYTEGDITSHAMAAFNQEDDITIGLIRFILDQNPQLLSAEKAFRDLARAYKDQREIIGELSRPSPLLPLAISPAGGTKLSRFRRRSRLSCCSQSSRSNSVSSPPDPFHLDASGGPHDTRPVTPDG